MDPDYWDALVADDRHAALAAVKRLRAAGASTTEVLRDHLLVAQRRVGELWATGEWTVAQEHAATSLNEGLLLWLGSFTPPPPRDGLRVVVACVEDERHALAALVVAETLMEHGVRVDHRGASVDVDALVAHVTVQRPAAVLLSASLTSSLGRATTLVRRLRETGVPVVVGGQAFGDDARRALAMGAAAWCPDPESAVRLLAGPLSVPADPVDAASPVQEEVDWVERFREAMVQYVVVGLRRAGGPGAADATADLATADLESWVDHVVGCLSATLATGDDTIMLEARDWLGQVLAARGVAVDLVREVLRLLREPVASRPRATALLEMTLDVVAAADAGQQAPWEPPGRPDGDQDDTGPGAATLQGGS